MVSTFGEQLKQAREAKNLNLEQVSQVTHIRVHYLQALEADQRDRLPSNVQGRGYLRLYADYLGLPIQPLLDAWDGKLPPPESVSPPPQIEFEPMLELLSARRDGWVNYTLPEPEYPSASLTPVASETSPGLTTEAVPSIVSPPPTADSQAIFIELGQALRKQRELLSLNLEDIERFTHVRVHYVRALEDGRIDDLPSPVQGRGMLSNYAHFLALDPEVFLLRFAEALQARRIENLAPVPKPGLFSRKKRAAVQAKPGVLNRLVTPDLVIGGLVIFVVFGFAIWAAAQVSTQRSNLVKPTIPAIGSVLLSTPMVPNSPTPSDEPLRSTTPGAQKPPELAPTSALLSIQTITPGGTLSAVSGGDQPLQVVIAARQRAFLRVLVDSKEVFNGRIVPGNAYPFSGKEKIEILSGNAAGLQVMFNNTDLGNLGVTGQVVRLVFSKTGAFTPTAIFSTTPTLTSQPTFTLPPSPTVPSPTVTPFVPSSTVTPFVP